MSFPFHRSYYACETNCCLITKIKERMSQLLQPTSNALQVSGAAAKSIKNKFVALFNPETTSDQEMVFPTPSKVAETPIETLRTAGLSQRKAE